MTEVFRDKAFAAVENRIRLLVQRILPCLDATAPIRILDLGCGTGMLTLLLAESLPRAQCVGVDVSQANIRAAEIARKGCVHAGRIRFVAQDYREFQDRPFDVIASWSVLHLIPASDKELLLKIAGDLVPGGILANVIPRECIQNSVLAGVRRVLALCRCELTDRAVFRLAKWVHGRKFSDEMIRQRVEYMYILPRRYDGPTFQDRFRSLGLTPVTSLPEPHAGLGQMRQRLTVFRKQTQ